MCVDKQATFIRNSQRELHIRATCSCYVARSSIHLSVCLSLCAHECLMRRNLLCVERPPLPPSASGAFRPIGNVVRVGSDKELITIRLTTTFNIWEKPSLSSSKNILIGFNMFCMSTGLKQ